MARLLLVLLVVVLLVLVVVVLLLWSQLRLQLRFGHATCLVATHAPHARIRSATSHAIACTAIRGALQQHLYCEVVWAPARVSS